LEPQTLFHSLSAFFVPALESFRGECNPTRDDDLAVPTERQCEMYEAVEIDGEAIRAVARETGLNPGTVCQHVQRAHDKLDAEGSR